MFSRQIVIIVAGNSGAGKSTVIRELAEFFRDRGMQGVSFEMGKDGHVTEDEQETLFNRVLAKTRITLIEKTMYESFVKDNGKVQMKILDGSSPDGLKKIVLEPQEKEVL